MPARRKPDQMEPGKALLPERSYIDVALEFANHQRFKTVEEAQSIYRKVSGIESEVVGPDRPDYWDNWLKDIRQEQTIVRNALISIVEYPDIPTVLEQTLNGALVGKLVVKAKLVGGRLQLHYEIAGVLGAAALGVAFLLHTDMAGQLRQCGWCAKFFLAEGIRNRAKFCRGQCAEENKAEKNRKRQLRHYQRTWLEENDPKVLADVEAKKITLAAAYEASRAKLRRK